MVAEGSVDARSLMRLKSLSWMRDEQAARLAAASEPLRVRREGVIQCYSKRWWTISSPSGKIRFRTDGIQFGRSKIILAWLNQHLNREAQRRRVLIGGSGQLRSRRTGIYDACSEEELCQPSD